MTRSSKLWFVTLLTVARFPLVLLFFVGAIVFSYVGWAWVFFGAMTALILSAVTDLLDGYFARRLGVVTPFGAHADPLMDKFFYLSTLPLLVFVATHNHHLGHAIILLVLTLFFLTRDQWVSFLRSIGSMYNVGGSANWSGKLRTCVNLPLICGIYYYEAAPAPFQFLSPWLVHGFEVVALVLNFISVYVYTRRYWPSLRRSADVDSDSPAPAEPGQGSVIPIPGTAAATSSGPVGSDGPGGQGSPPNGQLLPEPVDSASSEGRAPPASPKLFGGGGSRPMRQA